LEPFVNFVILRTPFADSSPSLFVRELVSSMASLVAHAVMKHCRYSDCLCDVLSKSQGRTRNCIVKTLVDAFIVVARDLVGTRLEVIEMHVFGVQLVDTVLLLFHQKASCVMLNKSKHIVEVVSMLVTILHAGYALEHVALEYLVVIVFRCFFMKEFFGA
ncbi:unnamed protein product, partial [Brassica oleracea]